MYETETAHHHLRVTDIDGVRLLTFERNNQSSMHLDDPFATDIRYVGYLHLALAVCPSATKTLVVGLGGGTVVKQMWRDYPWMNVDAVEIDSDVIDVCRDYFALPDDERIRVICEEGRAYLERTSERYDIIIIDAFDDDHVPRQLLTAEFLRVCKERLTPSGVIVYNVIGSLRGSRSKPFSNLYRVAAGRWSNVWVFPLDLADEHVESTRNIVVLASDADVSTVGLETRISNRVNGMVCVPAFERFGEDLYRGSIRAETLVPTNEPRFAGRSRRQSPESP
ncbi:MAG: hypothetical protein CVT67_03775 [Actinobacteria bacterium HGW-Actinobacteria-7]|nr:MAG: hypothetical protein CVT67_03775 [Actinobacteria bacterium HGW-Actinobacteria-7]